MAIFASYIGKCVDYTNNAVHLSLFYQYCKLFAINYPIARIGAIKSLKCKKFSRVNYTGLLPNGIHIYFTGITLLYLHSSTLHTIFHMILTRIQDCLYNHQTNYIEFTALKFNKFMKHILPCLHRSSDFFYYLKSMFNMNYFLDFKLQSKLDIIHLTHKNITIPRNKYQLVLIDPLGGSKQRDLIPNDDISTSELTEDKILIL
eukprot:NODE_410_length_7932_cov_0.253160.p4 type:complete len:203 gc:universal NODE_410_length_7932_cov_0.253160:7505-6897(-)